MELNQICKLWYAMKKLLSCLIVIFYCNKTAAYSGLCVCLLQGQLGFRAPNSQGCFDIHSNIQDIVCISIDYTRTYRFQFSPFKFRVDFNNCRNIQLALHNIIALHQSIYMISIFRIKAFSVCVNR